MLSGLHRHLSGNGTALSSNYCNHNDNDNDSHFNCRLSEKSTTFRQVAIGELVVPFGVIPAEDKNLEIGVSGGQYAPYRPFFRGENH